MGRTGRKRHRRLKEKDDVVSLGQDEELKQLMRWLKSNGFSHNVRLIPADFPSTGRGLKTLQSIAEGDIIANIPGKVLMNVESASKSVFGWLFRRRTFLTQQVLAAHLALEKHLGDQSYWAPYITSLPKSVATPVFTCSAEINSLPEELSVKVYGFKQNVSQLYKEVLEIMFPNDKCPHCDLKMSEIITIECFLWAWFIINSRAVYICPERNNDHDLKLVDSHCLALAPYLDIFNHTNDAKVQAFISEVDGSYRVKTLSPYKRFTQVFIHYGDHSNKKLYLEYGFILPNNIHDTLSVTFDDVYGSVAQLHQETNVSKTVYSFLKSHDLLSNLQLSADGLSWSIRALVYVLLSSEKVNPKTIQIKVFSNNFTDHETNEIAKVGKIIVEKKRCQLEGFLHSMMEAKDLKLCAGVSRSYLMAIELYSEYLRLLASCEQSLLL